VLHSSSYGLLHISSLPSLKDLQTWQKKGIGYLLNVSGIDLIEIYFDKDLEAFELGQMTFADVFSKGTLIDVGASLDVMSSETYLQLTTEEHQQSLLKAVQTLVEQLKKQIPTCVFCHRGQGRSPLVVAAAAQQFYHESIAEAIARTRIIRPPALFTDVSVSALQWCKEQLSKS
jgi:hypothetical protein